MWQRGDYEFIAVLNKVREGYTDVDVKPTLKLLFLEKRHILNMLCKYNETNFNNVNSQFVCIDGTDEFPRNMAVSEGHIDTIKQKN